MNELILLIPFVVSFLASLMSKKTGYLLLIISSIILAGYAILMIGLNTITFFYLIAAVALILSSWYSIGYDKQNAWLAPLFIAAALGISIILLSQNFLEFLAGWELMSVSGYLMIGMHKKDAGPAFVFSAFSELSTVFIIAGMAYAYVLTGSFSFGSIPSVVPLALMAFGFFIKMGVFPFAISDWEPIAVSSAPVNTSAMLSGLMTLMGVYGLVRVVLLSPSSITIGVALMAIGAFTVFFAALLEYVSENTKMLLGYSTIENNGAILIAIGLIIANPSGIAIAFAVSAMLMLCLAHSVGKTGLLLISGSFNSEDLNSISNGKDSKTTFGIILTSASLSGLLPTIGGVGTWMLLESLFITAAVSQAWLGIVAVIIGALVALGEAVATGAMVKFISFTQLRKKVEGVKATNIGPSVLVGILVVLFGVLSVFLVNNSFVTGNTAVGIPDGFLIASLTASGSTFGVVSPIFVAGIIAVFIVLILLVFGKPKVRRVKVWNNGIDRTDEYTSFGFANNIRIMMGRILLTKQDAVRKEDATRNPFWGSMVSLASAYREAARKITWNVMNSSMRWYISYLVIAFVFAMIFVIITS